MKLRQSYFYVSGLMILLIFAGIFIWCNKSFNQITKINDKPFNAPVSSKYIPAYSDFVIHWKINPTILPSYIKKYQNKVSRDLINKKTSYIIDSTFKLINLDFTKEISKWAGDYGSFAVFNSSNQNLNDWIIVLAIKEDVDMERELELILGSKIDDSTNNQENKIITSKTKIISKKINSDYSIYFSNDKDNLLISSNPEIIKSSFEKSVSDIVNTKKEYKNIQLKDNLKDGFLLLEMSPKKIFNLLGQKEHLFMMNEIDDLKSSINIDKNELKFEGIISYDVKTRMPAKDINFNLIDTKKESKLLEDFILVDNPYQYFRKGPSHPYQKLIATLINESTMNGSSNLLKIILEHTKGNLIWINNKNWLAFTNKNETSKNEIGDLLKKENFINSDLDLKSRELEIWTKIVTDDDEKYEIKEKVGAIIEEYEENYIWSQNLSSLSNLEHTNFLQNSSDKEQKLNQFNDFDDVLIIHLGEEKSKTFLNNFYPYILFKTMLGNKLTPPCKIDISIAVPTINYPDFIKVNVNLKTS